MFIHLCVLLNGYKPDYHGNHSKVTGQYDLCVAYVDIAHNPIHMKHYTTVVPQCQGISICWCQQGLFLVP